MEKKQIYIIAGLVLFVILIVAAGFWRGSGTSAPTAGMEVLQNTGAANGASKNVPATYSSQVPVNAVPTTPVTSVPAAPNSKAQFGIFDMSVDSSGFHPTSLTVKKGNVVQIKVTAVDNAYDMAIPSLGMYNAMKKGETKQFTFTPALSGTFLFECRDTCPAGKIQGSIIVVN